MSVLQNSQVAKLISWDDLLLWGKMKQNSMIFTAKSHVTKMRIWWLLTEFCFISTGKMEWNASSTTHYTMRTWEPIITPATLMWSQHARLMQRIQILENAVMSLLHSYIQTTEMVRLVIQLTGILHSNPHIIKSKLYNNMYCKWMSPTPQ